MSSTPAPSSTTRGLRDLPTAAAAAVAVVSAAVVSIALSAVVAAIAHSAGASHEFKALDVGAFAFFIVIGLLAATAAWVLIRSRAARPAHLLARLVPAVVVVSLVPDVVVGATGSLAGSSWGGVVALMVMHLIVAVAGVASLQFFLPVPASGRDADAVG